MLAAFEGYVKALVGVIGHADRAEPPEAVLLEDADELLDVARVLADQQRGHDPGLQGAVLATAADAAPGSQLELNGEAS